MSTRHFPFKPAKNEKIFNNQTNKKLLNFKEISFSEFIQFWSIPFPNSYKSLLNPYKQKLLLNLNEKTYSVHKNDYWIKSEKIQIKASQNEE